MQAWSLIAKKHPDWHLVLVGKESHHWPFRNVRQLGWVPEDDLPALYQEAQGLIYPSTYEGFGLPPLEAMAMRCPTIVSSVASLPEVCGEASLYVDPVSEDDIAQKICLLIEKPLIRQTLIEKGRQRVEQFNWEKSAQSHIELIHRML